MTAKFIKDLPNSGPAEQKLWSLDYPIEYNGGMTQFVVTSASHVPATGPETYVFAADAEGRIVDWLELPGSLHGALNHNRAINRFLAHHTKPLKIKSEDQTPMTVSKTFFTKFAEHLGHYNAYVKMEYIFDHRHLDAIADFLEECNPSFNRTNWLDRIKKTVDDRLI